MNLEEYARDLLEGVLSIAEADEEGEFLENVFTQRALEILTEADEVIDPQPCYFRPPTRPFVKSIKVNAYDYLDDSDQLDLLVADFVADTEMHRIPPSEIAELLGRGQAMLERSLAGLWEEVEESSPGFELARLIWEERSSLRSVRVLLLTNRLAPAKPIPDAKLGKIDIACQVWDIERFFQVESSGKGRSTVLAD